MDSSVIISSVGPLKFVPKPFGAKTCNSGEEWLLSGRNLLLIAISLFAAFPTSSR